MGAYIDALNGRGSFPALSPQATQADRDLYTVLLRSAQGDPEALPSLLNGNIFLGDQPNEGYLPSSGVTGHSLFDAYVRGHFSDPALQEFAQEALVNANRRDVVDTSLGGIVSGIFNTAPYVAAGGILAGGLAPAAAAGAEGAAAAGGTAGGAGGAAFTVAPEGFAPFAGTAGGAFGPEAAAGFAGAAGAGGVAGGGAGVETLASGGPSSFGAGDGILALSADPSAVAAANGVQVLEPLVVTAPAPAGAGLTAGQVGGILAGGAGVAGGAAALAGGGGASGAADVAPPPATLQNTPTTQAPSNGVTTNQPTTLDKVLQYGKLGSAGLSLGSTLLGGAGGGSTGEASVNPDQEAVLTQLRNLGLDTGAVRSGAIDEAQIRQQAAANASQAEFAKGLMPAVQALRQKLQQTFKAISGTLGPSGGGQIERAERNATEQAGSGLQALFANATSNGVGALLQALQGFKPTNVAQVPQTVQATQQVPNQFGNIPGAIEGIGKLYTAASPLFASSSTPSTSRAPYTAPDDAYTAFGQQPSSSILVPLGT